MGFNNDVDIVQIPAQLLNISETVVHITGRGQTQYFLTIDGSVYTAGANDKGQLGYGNIPIRVSLNSSISFVSTGSQHTLFVTNSGEALSLGNSYKQVE